MNTGTGGTDMEGQEHDTWGKGHIIVDTGCVHREDLHEEDLDRIVDKTEVADEMVRRALGVRRVIEREKDWTKKAEARMEDGCPVQFDYPQATQWCLTGAIDRTQKGDSMSHVRVTFSSYMVWTANLLGRWDDNGRSIAGYLADRAKDDDDCPDDGYGAYNPVDYLRWLNDQEDVTHGDIMRLLDKACCAANARAFSAEAECLTIHELEQLENHLFDLESPEATR